MEETTMTTPKTTQTLYDYPGWKYRELPETRIWNSTLTGDYATDEARVNEVEVLAKKFGGELELNYAHKLNLYRFEIGGRFETTKNADQFGEQMEHLFATWGD
jgi:hypothetical protein